ncbi:aldehyde dehydrogenase family protein [Moritella viscosa]|uniref:Aldehyde dehydrogenase (NAD) family protein n=1 Tax=Moritella viscosa TaxID=80854 RepID=A0ABY1HG84_9GAMM|nr:aldehyde dehydrogenase family protein [Moritella viscosa]SGY95096.1 Aldehyde dehydrogenase (NAD) family protein [Moritella viscosa]SGZ06997.1 Aldehyde dehydrogenase (NAD) family protein [Moritella viscosa]SHO26993.1 Aldehyde dehydrogenase (NAD) family protein [Moritella viscosa]
MPTLISYDAHTRNALGSVEITTAEQIPALISESQKTQKKWATLSLSERQKLVVKAYQRLEPMQNKLATLISKEMGKDYRRASYEAGGIIQSAAYFANEIAQALTSERLDRGTELQYRPLGIVALISPWNYPLAMANNLLMPALIAGNTVILKPSEETPLVAELFVNTLNQVLPKGVLQLAHGDKKTGQALVASNINMVAFTGSMSAGKHIMANAAPGLKRLVMELGGNDPMIVMANTNIDAAVQFAVASSFENAGQMCTSTERVYVDARIADEFEHKVVALARQYQVGAWDNPRVNIGPLVNPKQHENVLVQLQDATAKGAKILLGSDDQPLPFIQPTVVTGITPDMHLEQDETFGPVVAISHFEHIDEAIIRANDSRYGLGAVVFGGQGASAVAEQLEAGMIGVNQGVGGGNAPWVGAKQSGFGFHGSAAGHRQFSQVRVISK